MRLLSNNQKYLSLYLTASSLFAVELLKQQLHVLIWRLFWYGLLYPARVKAVSKERLILCTLLLRLLGQSLALKRLEG